MGIGILSIFGMGEKTALAWELIFIVDFVLFAFYIAHWEKYTTSIMYLPWAYDISQIVSSIYYRPKKTGYPYAIEKGFFTLFIFHCFSCSEI